MADPPRMAEADLKREESRLTGAWLRQAQKAYLDMIWQHRLRLTPATLGLMNGQTVWGRWVEEDRRLLLSRELFEHPWPAVLGILGHELAHQMASPGPRALDPTPHPLRWTAAVAPPDRPRPSTVDAHPHGAVFQEMGASLGLDPFYLRATVDLKDECPRPWPDRDAAPLEDHGARVLGKVRKLLALSGSPVEAEAQAALNAAARLMARHNLDILEAGRAAGGYEYRRIELLARRIDGRLGRLARILGRHFFVKTIFVPGYDPRTDTEGHDLELLGRPENTRLAEHVFHFLMERAESLWREYHRTHRGGGLAARNSFILALLDGFDEKLLVSTADPSRPSKQCGPPPSSEAGTEMGPGRIGKRADARSAVSRSETTELSALAATSSALVLSRDRGLNEFYSRRHPRVTTAYSGRRRVCPDSDRAGRAAGQALNFNRPLENGPAPVSQPLLLRGK